MYFNNVVVVTCSASSLLMNASRNTDLAVYNTVVTYECKKGYQFPDNSTRQSIICLETGQWNSTVSDCQRLYL